MASKLAAAFRGGDEGRDGCRFRAAAGCSVTTDPEDGAPARRSAPRPLAAHVVASAVDFQQGVSLALGAADPRFPWRDTLRRDGAAAGRALTAVGPEAAHRAVLDVAVADCLTALRGAQDYQSAPALRRPKPPNPVWRRGAARLLDYDMGAAEDGARPTLMALPSLVNAPWILDLTRARSFLRGLARRGVRPALLDWGDPGPEERAFDLADYVLRRAVPALEALSVRRGGPVALFGHCMSGALAAALAALRPELVDRVVLMAAPWDFAVLRPPPASRPSERDLRQLIDACGAGFGGVPSDILNTLFFMRDPLQATRKFPLFARRGRRSPQGRLFMAVEDWLARGPRLAAPAAQTLFVDWGLNDALARGRWRLDGTVFRPEAVAARFLVVASAADTVAPLAAVTAAVDAFPQAELLQPSGGHVGMLVGGRAEAEVWDPIAKWLAQ